MMCTQVKIEQKIIAHAAHFADTGFEHTLPKHGREPSDRAKIHGMPTYFLFTIYGK